MSKLDAENPQTYVSQSDLEETEADYHFPAADFVLVEGATLHLWVDGVHFIEDPEGAVREGQCFLVKDPGMGITISEIESVESKTEVAIVRHLVHWTEGELSFPNTTESWSSDEITGEYDRPMGDATRSVFIRRGEDEASSRTR